MPSLAASVTQYPLFSGNTSQECPGAGRTTHGGNMSSSTSNWHGMQCVTCAVMVVPHRSTFDKRPVSPWHQTCLCASASVINVTHMEAPQNRQSEPISHTCIPQGVPMLGNQQVASCSGNITPKRSAPRKNGRCCHIRIIKIDDASKRGLAAGGNVRSTECIML